MLDNQIFVKMVMNKETGEEEFVMFVETPKDPGWFMDSLPMNEMDLRAELTKAGIPQNEIDSAIIAARTK